MRLRNRTTEIRAEPDYAAGAAYGLDRVGRAHFLAQTTD